MSLSGEALLVELKIPRAMRPRVAEIVAIIDEVCAACLDGEYAELGRELVARLARKRPSPLVRGDVRIWAAGALYASQFRRFSPPTKTSSASTPPSTSVS